MANGFSISGNKFTLTIDDFSVGFSAEQSQTQWSNNGRNLGKFVTSNMVPNEDGSAHARRGISAVTGVLAPGPAAPTHINTYYHSYSGVEKDSSYTYPDYSIFGSTATNLTALNRTGLVDLGAWSASGMSSAPRIWSTPASVDDVQVFTTYEQRDSGTATAGTPGACWMYGGARMSATYSTGTCAATVGSATVTGTGTTWTANMVGGFLTMNGDSAGKKAAYRIVKFISATSLVLDRPYNGDTATTAYVIAPYSKLYAGNGSTHGWTAGDGYAVGAKCAVSAWGRVVLGGPCYAWSDTVGNAGRNYKPFRLQWSGRSGSTQSTSTAHTGIHAWDANGYVDLPAAGGHIIQLYFHDDRLFVLREQGLTILSGSPQFDSEGGLGTATSLDHLSWGVTESNCSGLFCSPIGPDLYILVAETALYKYSSGSVTKIKSPMDARWLLGANYKYAISTDGDRVYVTVPSNTTASTGWFVYYTKFDSWGYHTIQQPNSAFASAQQVKNAEDYNGSRGVRVYAFTGKKVIDVTSAYATVTPTPAQTDWCGGTETAAFYTGEYDLGNIVIRPKKMTVVAAAVSGAHNYTLYYGLGASHGDITDVLTMPAGYTNNDPIVKSLRLSGRRTTRLYVSASITPTITWSGIRKIVIEGSVVGNISQLSPTGSGMVQH